MKCLGARIELKALLFVAAAWGAAFALACRLTNQPFSTGDGGDSMAVKTLSGIRAATGGEFYKIADRTFHMGTGIYREKAFENWFTRLGQVITPAKHVHLHAENVNELVPWLYFTTRADPHNVEAYVVAAFWLSGEGGHPELAERVLNEARANNPGNYRVYLEKGRLALKEGRLAEAARMLDAAGALWERNHGTNEVQARYDRAEIMLYRGLLFEEQRNVPDALQCYHAVLALFPGREGIRERAEELTATGTARVAPSDMRKKIMFQHRYVCQCGAEEDHAANEKH